MTRFGFFGLVLSYRREGDLIRKRSPFHAAQVVLCEKTETPPTKISGSSRNLVGKSFGEQVEFSAVEEDSGAVVSETAEATSGGF